MPNCKYCGQPAGFLKFSHDECRKNNEQATRLAEGGRQLVKNAAIRALRAHGNLEELQDQVDRITQSNKTSTDQVKTALVEAWEVISEEYLNDRLIDANEESSLNNYITRFKLTRNDLNQRGTVDRVWKSVVLRNVIDGKMTTNTSSVEHLPIKFLKNEIVIWSFSNCDYYQDRLKQKMVSQGSGWSYRVTQGIHHRRSSFQSEVIEKVTKDKIDNGWVVATNKNLYFAGPRKSLRIPFDHMLSFHYYDDGIGILQDDENAMPQTFITNDGLFTYNLITNLARK